MQCPAESRDEDMGLQWSLAVPTSYQWQRASILAAPTPGPCQAWLQWEVKKPKTQAPGIKQRLDYPLSMSLSKTIPLWIPHGWERKKRHNFCSWRLQNQPLSSFLVSSPLPSHSFLVCCFTDCDHIQSRRTHFHFAAVCLFRCSRPPQDPLGFTIDGPDIIHKFIKQWGGRSLRCGFWMIFSK